ncbi:MAG: nicotinate (nicotinamide) nucleotide adenylyltransferase [Flavobacteriaceae bacterium]
MQKVGLFFGSFNPIHVGHLILANYFTEHTDLDEVWFIVSPQNPFKQKQSLLPNYHRLELVYRATQEYPKLKVSDIEFGLPTPSYTSTTLVHLEEKYPEKEFALLIGEDNLSNFNKWRNYDLILDRHYLYVYPRVDVKKIPEEFNDHPKIKLVEAPRMELSSSDIRSAIKAGKNIRPLMPPESWQYLDEMNFYKK